MKEKIIAPINLGCRGIIILTYFL